MRIKFVLRFVFVVVVLALFGMAGFSNRTRAANQPKEIRIGYQRNGVWPLLKAKEVLEKKYPESKISWSVFPAGQPLMEALNAGSIDIGFTGDTPPIFAQAAGTPLVYIAIISGSGAGNAIVVPENSPIKTVADLKGKKVAFQQASSSHLLTVKTLEKFGLTYSDIQPTLLGPSDARAAFQSGNIDAWTIWDPFRASAIKELNARVLVEGQDISRSNAFAEASKSFVEAYPDTVRGIVDEARTWQDWIYDNQDEFANILAKETGLDVEVIKFSLNTERQQYRWIDDEAVEAQQKVANIFFNLKLIPEKLNIKEVVWIGGENPKVEADSAATWQATAAATLAK